MKSLLWNVIPAQAGISSVLKSFPAAGATGRRSQRSLLLCALCVKRFSAFRSFFFGGAKKNKQKIYKKIFLCVNPLSSPFFFLEKKKMVVGETPTTGQKFKAAQKS